MRAPAEPTHVRWPRPARVCGAIPHSIIGQPHRECWGWHMPPGRLFLTGMPWNWSKT